VQEAKMADTEVLTLSVEQAARACGLSERMVRELIARREIPFIRVGRRVLIVKSHLSEWLNERTAVVA
jgi:excisionase family DNA binding protein